MPPLLKLYLRNWAGTQFAIRTTRRCLSERLRAKNNSSTPLTIFYTILVPILRKLLQRLDKRSNSKTGSDGGMRQKHKQFNDISCKFMDIIYIVTFLPFPIWFWSCSWMFILHAT
mmetsp:Transcript_9624/g.17732  ORF Transcript_9624/g.17732 Transcript_9624/m.17732 type:complete len:115 (+) Transcript_9624:599-943(+)